MVVKMKRFMEENRTDVNQETQETAAAAAAAVATAVAIAEEEAVSSDYAD